MRLLGTWLLLALLVTSCRSRSFITDAGVRLPVNPAWSIVPKDYSGSRKMDFKSIYVHESEMTVQDETYVSYNYFRFWPSGQVIATFSGEFPTADHVNSFKNAYAGYYRITGNEVIIELFAYNPGAHGWEYGRIYGEACWDRIIKNKSVIGSQEKLHSTTYDRVPMEGLSQIPSW